MKIIILATIIGIFCACKQDEYMVYEDQDRLQFGPTPDKIYTQKSEWEDTLKTFSFLSVAADKVMDTVYFDIYSIGLIRAVDRSYELEQVVIDSTDNAEPGVHFKAFDDPEVRGLYVIPANSAHAVVPIVLMRDTSLESREYVLKIRVKENENFKRGDRVKCWRKLMLSDILPKPTLWAKMEGYFGTYSKVKHKFMMEQTGMKWDDEYLATIQYDVSMGYYWSRKFQELLYVYNHNPENEDVPLRDEYGRDVKFTR